jgi:hypothetical protein
MADEMSRPDVAHGAPPFLSRILPATMVYWLATAGLMAFIFLPGTRDLIGPDNDDVMRLVEVRDWLSGQGWFDLMQYRLGLQGGTPMHWSRLIDAPIGGLITLLSVFMSHTMAEGVVASIWPLFLSGLLLLALGLAGRRMGGVPTMHVALGLGAIFVFTCIKFRPGALDHHNVQLVLAMAVAALLADRAARTAGHAAAGAAAALAIAVGAETVPFVAAACLCVAGRWIWQGTAFAMAARAFGLSLALSITAAFLATVPPSAYAAVTCDNLSLGFYSLTALGGAGLFGLACLPGRMSFSARLAGSAMLGGLLGLAAFVIAPQCLASPLAGLDPMLVQMWLKGVTEARALSDQIRVSPETVAGFYAVGLAGLVVCAARIWRREDIGLHLLFLVLIATTWGVSLVQIRGSFFANLLSIPPFALLIADLQRKARENPKSLSANIGFIAVTLAAVPAVWGLAGVVWKQGVSSVSFDMLSTENAGETGECGNAADMAALGAIEPGTVAAPSNSGADILRFTSHRVLSAPYHRNQGGMLTELHVGMSAPAEAAAFLRGADVTIIAFCKSDPQTRSVMALKKDGLYALLARDEVPTYLMPIQHQHGGFRLFRVRADDGE